MTEEEKVEFMRIRMARYNALSYEDKIFGANLGYRFSINSGELTLARKHLFRAIELIIEKIENRHCLTR
jgi:hypothetical protein